RRKWNMQEEADARVRNALPEHPRQKAQLVVLHPDAIARAIVRRDDVCELLVDPAIRVPIGGVDRDQLEQIMEERPEDAVREAVVVPRDVLCREVHGGASKRGELLVERAATRVLELRDIAGPADPKAVRALMRPTQTRGE